MWKNIAHEESESTYISLKHKQLNGAEEFHQLFSTVARQ
jgi:hypothetical protein